MKTVYLFGLFCAAAVVASGCKSDGPAEPAAAVVKSSEPVVASKGPLPLSRIQPPDDSLCRGRPVEVIETFWPSGSIKLRREVVRLDDGTIIDHGKNTSYWEEGGKKVEYSHVCGVRHGPKLAWHVDGSKWQEMGYANGHDHGVWKEWYSDGTPARRWTLDQGAWNGTYTEWHPSGKKRREVEWVNGVRQGPEIFWDEFGREIKRVDYVDGVPQP